MTKRTVMLLSFLTVLFMAGPTWAAIIEESWTLTPFAGGYMFDGDENLDTSLIYGAKLGYDFTKHFGLEMSAAGLRTHANDDYGDIAVKMFEPRLDALIYFMPDSAIVPFFSLGVGGRSMSHGDQHGVYPDDFAQDLTLEDYNAMERNAESSHFLVDTGIGAKFFLAKRVALRADVRYVLPLNDALNNFEATLGLSFVMGGKKPAPAPAPVAAPAPAPAPVVEPAPAPAPEPEPAPVVAPAPAPTVMEKEIVEKGRATLDVKFKTNSAVILPESDKDLSQFADVMQKYPDLKVEIAGHTDSTGTDKYNQQLSQKRADSVKKYLADKYGVEANRLTAKGYGEAKPIADNKTKVGRAKNRRVEAVVDYTYTVKEKVQE